MFIRKWQSRWREILEWCHTTRGRFHKSWVQGANHRDSSIHLHSVPMPNFWEAFYWRKSVAQSAKDLGRAQNSFLNRPQVSIISYFIISSINFFFFTICQFLSLFFSLMFNAHSVDVNVFFYFFISLYILGWIICHCFSLFVFLSVNLCLSFRPCLSVCLSVCLSLSLPLFLSLSLSLSLFLSLPISLSLSLTHTHTFAEKQTCV